MLNIDNGREVQHDGETSETGAGAIAFFDRLCDRRKFGDRAQTKRRDPKVVMNW